MSKRKLTEEESIRYALPGTEEALKWLTGALENLEACEEGDSDIDEAVAMAMWRTKAAIRIMKRRQKELLK